MALLKIAIIGAGPAGCTLARLLCTSPSSSSFDLTIFESDSTPNFRGQGGTLDLHTNTGILALQKCGLHDKFLEKARYDGEALSVTDKKRQYYLKTPGSTKKSSHGRPEIDRAELRRILTESIPDGKIRYGKRLQRVEQVRENGTYTLYFKDEKVLMGFDLVIGAEGAWSKVRTLVSDVKPHYSGVGGHRFSIPTTAEGFEETAKIVNRGSLFTFSDGKSIMAQQMGDGSLSASTWGVRSEDWMETCEYDPHNPIESRAAFLKDYNGPDGKGDWAPELVKITQQAGDADFAPMNLYMLPIGFKWEHRKGVTLLGDAAHLMTPFAGEGVNLALEDAMKLAEAIISSAQAISTKKLGTEDGLDILDKTIKDYEEKMFVRTAKTAYVTYWSMYDMYFVEGAPRTTIERWILRIMSDELPKVLYPVAWVAIYTVFFFYKLIW